MASDNGWYGAPKWVFERTFPLPLEERYWLLDLCQMACRTESHEHEGIMLGPRETIVSLQFMARRWGVHKSRIRRFLAHLKATQLATPLATHPIGTRILLARKLFPAMTDTAGDTASDTASDTKEKRSSYTEEINEHLFPPPPPPDEVLAVGRFLQQTDTRWGIQTPIRQWVQDRILSNGRFAGVDISWEMDNAIEWVQGNGKKLKQPSRFILRWLDRAASTVKDEKRKTKGPTYASRKDVL